MKFVMIHFSDEMKKILHLWWISNKVVTSFILFLIVEGGERGMELVPSNRLDLFITKNNNDSASVAYMNW